MSPGLVLVVDDDDGLREDLAAYLDMHGVPTKVASDGIEALRALATGPLPSLIILDLMMPRMNGVEFRARQRLDPRIAAIPVIILTASHDGRAESEELGAAAYFAKPLDLDAFIEEVVDRAGRSAHDP
jgi:CheY-like chemotaxis protein